MTHPTPRPGTTRSHLLLLLLVGLLMLVVVGRLALDAWLLRPAPDDLPEIGATTDEARPFLLVVLDGLSEEGAWGTAPDGGTRMPRLASLARDGAWGIAMAGDPTLTAPCVRALLSGRAPDLITGFANFDADPIHGTVIEYLHDRGAHTAHAGDASVWQLCRHAYADEDVLAVPDRGPVDQGETDDAAVPFLLGRLEAGADVLTLHLTRPDHVGHMHGARGEAYAEACRIVDRQVGRVAEAFLARHPEGLVLVAADHGVSPTGTHGGGEAAARRAPFVLRGPGVAPQGPVTISQMALAPTVAALLGLPQPPLADAPPAVGLLEAGEAERTRVLDAYVRARVAVARLVADDAVDPIERRRAQVAARRMAGDEAVLEAIAADVNRLVDPSEALEAVATLLLAALALAVLLRLADAGAGAPRGVALLAGLALAALASAFGLVGTLAAACLLLAVLLLAALLPPAWPAGRAPRDGVVIPAALLAIPVVTGGGLALQAAVERAPVAAWPRMLVAAGIVFGLLALTLRPARWPGRLRAILESRPGLVVAVGGMALGFTLTLRPFVDPILRMLHPLLDLRVLISFVGVGAVACLVMAPAARRRSRRLRASLLLLAALLFLGPRVADVVHGGSWLEVVAREDATFLVLGLLLVVPVVLAAGPRALGREDLPGLALALLALAAAFTVRVEETPGLLLARGANAAGIAALLWTGWRGTPDGRLLVRLLAAIALARRLTALDGEMIPFVLLALGAALAARLGAPRTRGGLAAWALGLLAVRTAAFHAMGGVESFSTVDVAAGFVGMEAAPATPLDPGRISPTIIEATLQLSLRFALPWIVLLAAAARAFGDRARLRTAIGYVALSFAARGAAIAWALWAWWRSAWWMERAYPVYALGAADVVLLGLAALLVGAFWRGAPGYASPSASPSSSSASPSPLGARASGSG